MKTLNDFFDTTAEVCMKQRKIIKLANGSGTNSWTQLVAQAPYITIQFVSPVLFFEEKYNI